MATEFEPNIEMEIAHVLLLDVVGYSKLLVNGQIEVLDQLNQIVRNTARFRDAEAKGKLMRLPTGDGMALIFFDSPESPVQCALEVSAAIKDQPQMQLRMGAHSGAIKEVKDVNDRSNFAGAGINTAQRVLDCGDAGHILVSQRLAEDLAAYRHWHTHLHDLGDCEVKHGVRLHLFNVCKDGLGNSAMPQKIAEQRTRGHRWRRSLQGLLPTSRFQQAALLLGVVAIALGLTIVAPRFSRRPLPSIAVLPFGNLSDEKGNAYFVDGVQDEIITDLSRVPDLKVISRTSVMRYRDDATRNLRDIGRACGVTHVLEGNVQRVGNHVRVHAQLVDARTDAHLWADRYDSDETDVFDIQSDIAQRIVAQLKIKLSAQVKAAIAERPTNDPVAYDLYVRAKGLINAAVFSASANENLTAAVRDLNEAVARDRNFYLAYCQLAHAQDQLYQRFDRTPARLTLADAALRKLVALRPDSGETHLALAKHYYWALGDFDRARQELVQAEAELPNDSVPPLLSGYIDRRQGRWSESTRNLNRALELDPQNNSILRQLALSYFNLRRFEEMTTVLQRAINLAPDDLIMRAQLAAVELEWHADTRPLHATIETSLRENPANGAILVEQWMYLALCERDWESAARALESLGDHGCYTEGLPLPRSWCEGMVARLRGDETTAREAFRRGMTETKELVSAQPQDGGARCVLGLLHSALGENEDAIRAGRRAVELLPMETDAIDAPLMLGYLAIIYSWAGENDLAIEQLTKATKVPSYWSYGNLRLHPYWDALRKDPRFAQIVESLAPKDR